MVLVDITGTACVSTRTRLTTNSPDLPNFLNRTSFQLIYQKREKFLRGTLTEF
jgi:hypothetical protein